LKAEVGSQSSGAEEHAGEDLDGLFRVVAVDRSELLLRAEITGEHGAEAAGAELPEELAQLGRFSAFSDDDAMEAPRLLGEDEIEHLRTEVDEGVAQAAAFAKRADGFKELPGLALNECGEEGGLAGIARVERLLGGAGATGDFTHAGALETL